MSIATIHNEDEGNRLIGEFISLLSRLCFLISGLVGKFYEDAVLPASNILEEEFNKISQENQKKGTRNCNYQTFEVSRRNNTHDLTTLIFTHFSHLGQLIQCLKKQIDSLALGSYEKKEINKLLDGLDEIVELRNDLLHSGLATTELQRGIGIYRLRFKTDGNLIQKPVVGFVDVEIQNLRNIGSDLKSWIYRIIHNYKIVHKI